MKPLPDYTRGFGVKLEWESKDSGIAGVANYEAQFRTEADSVWRHFLYNYSPSQNFSGRPAADFIIEPAELIPGQAKVYFRVRARDDAENVEPWRESQEGYASTKFYLHEVSGSRTDQRGITIPKEQCNKRPK